jgi:hypothetical protein
VKRNPFFCDDLNSGAFIFSKELNQDPELFKSFYRMNIGTFFFMDIVGTEV